MPMPLHVAIARTYRRLTAGKDDAQRDELDALLGDPEAKKRRAGRRLHSVTAMGGDVA